MGKKLPWPVAKVRDDGTPAIWLTHNHWLILEEGIVRKYLAARGEVGLYNARQEQRREIGEAWRTNARLKEWEFLDSALPAFSNDKDAMELFKVGYDAWSDVARRVGSKFWTPESLTAAGDRAEQTWHDEELKAIQGAVKEAA